MTQALKTWLTVALGIVVGFSASAQTSGGGTLGFSINLQPPSRFGNIGELVNAVSQYLLQIAIPLGVLMIIYAGIRFVLARGNPGEVSKAKSILWYVLLGLAIVIIGVGFINLITNFLGQPSTSP